MITAFRPAYLPLSTRTTLPDFIIFPILYRMYQLFCEQNNLKSTIAVHKQPEKAHV